MNLYDFQALISAVNAMMVGGQFRLTRQEIVAQNGSVVYIASSAQDRLRDMLNAARPDLMLPVSAWINHLYYCELLYLNRQAVAAGPVMEADGWMAHSYRNVITQSIVHVQSPAVGQLLHVPLDRLGQRLRVTVADLRSELLASNIRMGQQHTRSAVLLRRRQLMAHNASLIDRR